jgi:ABC-type Zn uptake system ZnuABC Zn-binding protein ZnuA
MNRRTFLSMTGVALLATLPLIVIGCVGGRPEKANDPWQGSEGKTKVVVSFAPLYCLATNVAGDDAVVKNVMTTTGPHDFNPTDADVRLVAKSDIMFIIGLGLDERQAEAMKTGSGNDKLTLVELAEKLPKDKLCEGHCDHADHDADHKHDTDPHVWLSPDLAVLMVGYIRDELKAKDPAHAANYDKNAADYIVKLNRLKADGVALLKGKKDNRIITFHDSMTYFAEAYGLDIRGVLTQKPGQEPDDKQLKKLIRICTNEEKPTRVIVTEPQYSTSPSGGKLCDELIHKGVRDPVLVEFDTLETAKPDDLKPDWYETKMRANIAALAEKLK